MENAEFRLKARNLTPKWGSDPSNGGQTLQPPEELDMAMQSYIEQLKADTVEASRLREKAKAKPQHADTRILYEVPLLTQVQELMLSWPPVIRDKSISLHSLRAQLKGKYNPRPSAGDLGIVLTALGFVRKRDFSKNGGGGRRYWLPSSKG